jgi:hypothetical protein
MAIFKSNNRTNASEDTANQEPLYTELGMQINTTTMENSMEIPQNLKIVLTYDLVIPLLASTERNLNQVTIETPIHRCSLQHYSQ